MSRLTDYGSEIADFVVVLVIGILFFTVAALITSAGVWFVESGPIQVSVQAQVATGLGIAFALMWALERKFGGAGA